MLTGRPELLILIFRNQGTNAILHGKRKYAEPGGFIKVCQAWLRAFADTIMFLFLTRHKNINPDVYRQRYKACATFIGQ